VTVAALSQAREVRDPESAVREEFPGSPLRACHEITETVKAENVLYLV
jgi:hypothetical protein